jgi:spermidine/putrescine transport system substrate-binding protein
MSAEPREHLLRRRGPTSELSRRQFLRASAGVAVALPGLSSILAACTKPGTGGPSGGSSGGGSMSYPLARPDHPVTLPIHSDIPAIADNLPIEKGVTLKLFNWSDYMYKKVINDFCTEFNCDYEYTTFNNMSEGIQKMSSGQVADVFIPTPDQISKLVYGKLLQPLNHSYIPNLEANIWPVYQNPFYDQGWLYTVPYATYTTGVAYRRDVIPDDEASAQGWDLVWNPKYNGKVGIYDDFREALSMAMLRKGQTDLNTGDQAIIDQAQKDLQELIGLVSVRTTTNGVYQQLPDGVFDVHQAWCGDIIGAQWYLNDLKTPGASDILGYWYPEDNKGPINNDVITIPATAEHPVLAHAFLNFMLDEKHAFDNFTWNGYQPPLTSMNAGSLIQAKLGQYVPGPGPGTVPPSLPRAIVYEDMFKKGYFELELSPADEMKWQTAWQNFQAGA